MPDPTLGTPPYLAANDPTQQAPYSYGPTVMPYSLGGSPYGLGGYGSMMNDPDYRRQMAFDTLTGAGLGLLQASSPSPYPTTFGSMFGGLAGGAAQAAQGSRQNYIQQQMGMAQLGNMRIQQQAMSQLPYILGQGGGQPQAATNPGTPPAQAAGGDYKSTLATGESGSNYTIPNAQGSGAYGKYQFMPNTWANVASAHPELNLPFNMKQATPEHQEAAMDALTADNGKALQGAGIQPTPANLALAHWVGADGAVKVLAAKPETPIGDILGKDVLEKNPGLRTTAGELVGGLNKKYSGVQMAQAGGGPTASGDTPFPGAPPQITQQQQMGLLNPMTRPLIQAQITQQQHQYDARVKAWEANNKLRTIRREEANAEVIVGADGVARPNPARIEADTQKKVGEAKATEVARKEAIFGGKDWEKFSPEELRKKANPEALALVEQVQSGQTKIGDISARAGSGGISVGKNDVMALGKKLYGDEWDPNAGERRQKFENDTTDTSSQTGKTLYSINTVYKHLNRYQELTDAINNRQTPLVNELLRHYNNAAGYEKYSSAEALQHSLGTEMAAVIKGQQLNLPEVESAVDTIATTKSPEQMHGALAVLRHAMGDRESTITWAARRAKVPDSRIQALIDPDARAAISNFDQKQAEFQKQQEQKAAEVKAQPAAGPVRLGSQGQGYDALAPGTQYVAPDGSLRIKGGK